MGKTVDQSVKQAGAIMLKNHCHSFWADREITAAGDSGINFVIHENDKAVSADSHCFGDKYRYLKYIRENIVESIIASNELLRNQLTVIANHIIKHDYPHKFPEVNEKILAYLQVLNLSYFRILINLGEIRTGKADGLLARALPNRQVL